jgi:hypothetical protein
MDSSMSTRAALSPGDAGHPRIERRHKTWATAASILTALVHVPFLMAVALDAERFYYLGDAPKYLTLTLNLLEHHVFSRSLAAPFEPDILLTPGYPAFVAAIFALTSHSEIAVVIAQAILRALTTWLLIKLGWRLFASPEVGLVAGFAYSCAPIPALFVAVLSPETLFTTLLIALLLLFTLQPTIMSMISTGVLFGLGILTRPIGLVTLLVFPLVELYRSRLPRALAYSALLLAAAGVVVAPWLVRNHRLFGYAAMTSVSSYNLLNYTAASTLARANGTGFDEGVRQANAIYQAQVEAKGPPLNAALEAKWRQETAIGIIMDHPVETVISIAVDSLNTLRPGVSYAYLFLWPGSLPPQTSTSTDFSPIWGATLNGPLLFLAVCLTFLYGLLYLLSMIGLVICLRTKNWFSLLVIVPVALTLLVAPGAAGNARFRIPFEPLLFLLAALASIAVWKRLTLIGRRAKK